MKMKKHLLLLMTVVLCIVVYMIAAKPVIAKGTWVLSLAQQAEPPHSVVAHHKDYDFSNEESSLFEFSKPIELICEAKDGKLVLTDKTNGETYEGTYKVKTWKKFTNQSFTVVIEGVEGVANISSRLDPTLFVSIGDYYLTFDIR